MSQSGKEAHTKIPEGSKRVDANVMMVALLDELNERIMSLQKTLPVRPEGIVEPLTPQKISVDPKVIHPPMHKKWFALSIVNDGPEDCWIVVNTEKSPPQPYMLRAGESDSVDMGNAVIEDIRAYTESGFAYLRIKGIR